MMLVLSISGTPVAGDIVVDPGIEFKPVEANSLLANWDFCQVRSDLSIKPVAIHADVPRCVPEADDPREHSHTAASDSAAGLPHKSPYIKLTPKVES